jgi:hypothetical protein
VRRGCRRLAHLCRHDTKSNLNLAHHLMGKTGAAQRAKIICDH